MNFVFICENGAKIGVKKNRIYVEKDDKVVLTFPLELTDSLFIIGKSTITPDAVTKLYQAGSRIIFLTRTGKLKFFLMNPQQGKVSLRLKQYNAYFSTNARYETARYFLIKKIESKIEILAEKYRDAPNKKRTISELKYYLEAAKKENRYDFNILRGIEGNAARIYFEFLKGTIKNEKFIFERREYRPAKDMFNCGISFCYGIARSIITPVAYSYGYDVYVGFLHAIADSKPSLSLDLLEEFRAFLDFKFIKAVNLRVLDEECFYFEKDGSCFLTEQGLRRLLKFFYEEVLLNGNDPSNPYFLNWITKGLKDFEKHLVTILKEDKK